MKIYKKAMKIYSLFDFELLKVIFESQKFSTFTSIYTKEYRLNVFKSYIYPKFKKTVDHCSNCAII